MARSWQILIVGWVQEMIVFDLLGIDLVHGWLIDPQVLPLTARKVAELAVRAGCRDSGSVGLAHIQSVDGKGHLELLLLLLL